MWVVFVSITFTNGINARQFDACQPLRSLVIINIKFLGALSSAIQFFFQRPKVSFLSCHVFVYCCILALIVLMCMSISAFMTALE